MAVIILINASSLALGGWGGGDAQCKVHWPCIGGGGGGRREEGEMQAQVVKSTNLISCFKNQLELQCFFVNLNFGPI